MTSPTTGFVILDGKHSLITPPPQDHDLPGLLKAARKIHPKAPVEVVVFCGELRLGGTAQDALEWSATS